MENKLSQMLKNMNPETLRQGIKRASEFVKTPEGKKVLEELKGLDKNELLKRLGGDETIISQSEKEELLRQLTSNPELMRKLSEFLK